MIDPSPINLAELSNLADLMHKAFSTGPERPWDRAQLAQSLGQEHVRLYQTHAADGELQAAALMSLVPPEAELLVIAVLPTQQGQGVARALMAKVLAACKELGCASMWLDVRSDNVAAVRLYQRFGAQQISRRAGYYQLKHGGRQDALMMKIEL